MSKRNYIIDSKTFQKAIKDAEKVNKIKSQIEKLHRQLEEIKEENNWMNYLGSNACKGLTQDERYEFAEVSQILNYADRVER